MGETGDLLKVLGHRTNQAILNLLQVEPTYPRKIGDLLGLAETEVARRLRVMEKLGLVTSDWAYIGKNVKLYQLVVDRVTLAFTAEGFQVDVHERGGGQRSLTVNPFVMQVPQPDDFVGRKEELDLLEGPQPVVVVEGMPGIGKTSLLATYARAQMGAKPLFWHSFRGVESLNWLANHLGVFLAQHGWNDLLDAVERGADTADKRTLLLQALDREGVVIVLDDIHRIDDDVIRDVLVDAMAMSRNGKLVVGGRQRPHVNPAMDHIQLLHLQGLTDADVAAFTIQRGLELQPTELPRLRNEVGGHPLALSLFVETVKSNEVEVADLLDLVPEQDLEEYLLGEIYQKLADDERRVLGLASLFRGPFTEEQLSAFAGRNVTGSLLRLRRRLLVQVQEQQYALHEILRNFFHNLLHDKPHLHAKLGGLFAEAGSLEGRLEAMHHYLAAGKRDDALALIEQDLDLDEFDLIDAGYHNLYYQLLDTFDRREVHHDRHWALILDEKADILYHRAQYEQALPLYWEADGLFRDAKDTARAADVGWKTALCLQRLDRAAEARSVCQDALTLAPKDGQERERLEALAGELAAP